MAINSSQNVEHSCLRREDSHNQVFLTVKPSISVVAGQLFGTVKKFSKINLTVKK